MECIDTHVAKKGKNAVLQNQSREDGVAILELRLEGRNVDRSRHAKHETKEQDAARCFDEGIHDYYCPVVSRKSSMRWWLGCLSKQSGRNEPGGSVYGFVHELHGESLDFCLGS